MLREREREKNVRFECCAVEKHDAPVLKAIVVVLLRVLNACDKISWGVGGAGRGAAREEVSEEFTRRR